MWTVSCSVMDYHKCDFFVVKMLKCTICVCVCFMCRQIMELLSSALETLMTIVCVCVRMLILKRDLFFVFPYPAVYRISGLTTLATLLRVTFDFIWQPNKCVLVAMSLADLGCRLTLNRSCISACWIEFKQWTNSWISLNELVAESSSTIQSFQLTSIFQPYPW